VRIVDLIAFSLSLHLLKLMVWIREYIHYQWWIQQSALPVDEILLREENDYAWRSMIYTRISG